LEYDASIVHDDYYFGDVSKPNHKKLSQLVSLAENGILTLDNLCEHKANISLMIESNEIIFRKE
jgi:hypothetical protein